MCQQLWFIHYRSWCDFIFISRTCALARRERPRRSGGCCNAISQRRGDGDNAFGTRTIRGGRKTVVCGFYARIYVNTMFDTYVLCTYFVGLFRNFLRVKCYSFISTDEKLIELVDAYLTLCYSAIYPFHFWFGVGLIFHCGVGRQLKSASQTLSIGA